MSDSTLVYFNFLNKPINISSILCEFSVFGHDITIRWYGAIIAFGFLLAVLLGGRIAYTWKMSLDKMVDVLIYGTLSGIVAQGYITFFQNGTITVITFPKFPKSGKAVLLYTVA